MIKSKVILGMLMLTMLSACSQAQEIKIIVLSEEQVGSQLKLYSASKKDTVELKQFDNLIFKVNDRFFENHTIIHFESSVFNLGEIKKPVNSIILKLSNTTQNDCYAIHRIYGDVMQSDLERIKGCDAFDEISIYDKSNSEKDENPDIKLRKKNN